MWAEHVVPFSTLEGLTITAIERNGADSIKFATKEGRNFKMSYYEDCCASCSIEEVHGDLDDLIGHPVLMAEEVSSREPEPEVVAYRAAEKAKAEAEGRYWYDSHESETWTFYKLATVKGSVTIRWYGSSNGYYSESATFEELKK
jgi:hypothetical protein